MASRARARSTWAAGALGEQLRRVKAIRSSGVSGRRGSFRWRDMRYLGARGSPIIIPDPMANNPLALAEIDDGGSRTRAARIGGVGLQTLRDWVVRFNAHGPDGLIDGKAPGNA